MRDGQWITFKNRNQGQGLMRLNVIGSHISHISYHFGDVDQPEQPKDKEYNLIESATTASTILVLSAIRLLVLPFYFLIKRILFTRTDHILL